jgi:hypothetical protein
MPPKVNPRCGCITNGLAKWTQECFYHSIVSQPNEQRLAHFSTIYPQLICNRVANRATKVKGACEVTRYFTELAFLRPRRQMKIGPFYRFMDQRPHFGTKPYLPSLKLRMMISNGLFGLSPFGFVLTAALLPHVECYIKLFLQ